MIMPAKKDIQPTKPQRCASPYLPYKKKDEKQKAFSNGLNAYLENKHKQCGHTTHYYEVESVLSKRSKSSVAVTSSTSATTDCSSAARLPMLPPLMKGSFKPEKNSKKEYYRRGKAQKLPKETTTSKPDDIWSLESSEDCVEPIKDAIDDNIDPGKQTRIGRVLSNRWEAERIGMNSSNGLYDKGVVTRANSCPALEYNVLRGQCKLAKEEDLRPRLKSWKELHSSLTGEDNTGKKKKNKKKIKKRSKSLFESYPSESNSSRRGLLEKGHSNSKSDDKLKKKKREPSDHGSLTKKKKNASWTTTEQQRHQQNTSEKEESIIKRNASWTASTDLLSSHQQGRTKSKSFSSVSSKTRMNDINSGNTTTLSRKKKYRRSAGELSSTTWHSPLETIEELQHCNESLLTRNVSWDSAKAADTAGPLAPLKKKKTGASSLRRKKSICVLPTTTKNPTSTSSDSIMMKRKTTSCPVLNSAATPATLIKKRTTAGASSLRRT